MEQVIDAKEEMNMEENKNCGCGCGCDEEENVNGCSCGCGDEEESIIYVTFDDEDDTEVPCSVLDIFECNGTEYIAIAPKSDVDNEDEAEVYFYRYSEDGEEVKLDDIETDEEWNDVAELFDQNFFGGFDEEE